MNNFFINITKDLELKDSKGKLNNLEDILKASESHTTQSAIACSRLTIETLEQSVKYVQSYQ